MLEVGTYTQAEMRELLGTDDTQGINRKLNRYGVIYERKGRAPNATYVIQAIGDPFKMFAITQLGFDGNTDFRKLRNLYYYFFNDEEFSAMPDEVKEARMAESGKPVSRQVIARYLSVLERNELINRHTNNFIYYFAYKQTQRIVEREEYSRAWREYWKDKRENGYDSFTAIMIMRENYGGVARKQAIPEINGIYNDVLEEMLNYIQLSIENEMLKTI